MQIAILDHDSLAVGTATDRVLPGSRPYMECREASDAIADTGYHRTAKQELLLPGYMASIRKRLLS